jgi:hypothetical protein
LCIEARRNISVPHIRKTLDAKLSTALFWSMILQVAKKREAYRP